LLHWKNKRKNISDDQCRSVAEELLVVKLDIDDKKMTLPVGTDIYGNRLRVQRFRAQL
jgi:hypothetical protein